MGIIESLPVRSWKPMIAEVKNGRILLNGGADRGYVLGQVYIAREPARPVTDPNTGDVISYLSGKEVGWLRVFQVDQKIAIAEAIQGSGFRRGMPLFVERR
jgi:hypothetical protein